MTENGTFLYPRYGPLWNIFFSLGNQFFLFYNFNTATQALKIKISKKKIWHGALPT
jgi:hypothetical protein